jgi:hypothetical protein
MYKLTDQRMQTRNGFQWELNKTYTTNGKGYLCGPGWLHVYEHPLLAVLLNPIHADIKNPRLFRCKIGGKCLKNKGLKCGYTKVTLTKELQLPQLTLTQRIAFGILCAKQVYKNKRWNTWANDWLSNKNRNNIDAAAYAAYAAAYAAYAADAINNINLFQIAKQALKYK